MPVARPGCSVWPHLLALCFCQKCITVANTRLLIIDDGFAGFRRRITDRTYVPLTPIILNTTASNYTYVTGETAILYCAVENLGTKTVSRKAKASKHYFNYIKLTDSKNTVNQKDTKTVWRRGMEQSNNTSGSLKERKTDKLLENI